MTAGTDQLKEAFRDFETSGIPATGPNEPDKAEIRAALDSVGLDILAAAGASSGTAVADIVAAIEPIRDDAQAFSGFSLRSDAITFAPKMTAGEQTSVWEADTGTHAAVAGEVRLDGTAATVDELIPNEGRYTWNGAALLRTGSSERQLSAAQVALATAQADRAAGYVGTIVRANLLTLEEGIAAPKTMFYTSTAGRYRLTASGFVICAASEERLCYDTSGRLLGTMLQPADIYYSASWHDTTAPHTSADPVYLTKSVTADTITYAGGHTQADIFGTTGKGFVLAQNGTSNGFFQAPNIKTPAAAAGDVIRVHAILDITPGPNGANSFQLRHSTSAFAFTYDATGAVTGFTENWASHRVGYFDMGVINGVRRFYVWWDSVAAAGTQYSPGIGFSGNIDVGRKIHVDELMIQRNPVAAPAAVPVCAANKTFAADTINTGITQNVGYVMPYLAAARSMAPLGKITSPAINVGLPYLPIEKEIRVIHSTETADRSGIMHNENEAYYLTPWRASAATWTMYLGPSAFPATIEQRAVGKGSLNSVIESAFGKREDQRPYIKAINTSQTYLTGTLTLARCISLGMCDKATTMFWQEDIRQQFNSSQYLAAGAGVTAVDNLVVGCAITHSRARHQLQDDDTFDDRACIGEFTTFVVNGAQVLTGNRYRRMGRALQVGGTNYSLDFSNSYFDLTYSDHMYLASGTITCVGNNIFWGRIYFGESSLWQSRREIDVDLLDGQGWRSLSSAGKTWADLKPGVRMTHFGTYNFDTGVFTEAPDEKKSVIARSWDNKGPLWNRPGWQVHLSEMDYGDYNKLPELNDVFLAQTATMRIRFVIDGGHWNIANTAWVAVTDGTPAWNQTGTHPGNMQGNGFNVFLTSCSMENVLQGNCAEGQFLVDATTNSTVGTVTIKNMIGISTLENGVLLSNRNATGVPAKYYITDSIFMPMRNDYRYANGYANTASFLLSGPQSTLYLTNAWWATTYTVPGKVQNGATVVGERKVLPTAKATFGNVVDSARPSLANLLDEKSLDPIYKVVKAEYDVRYLGFTAYGELKTGIPLNNIVKACVGNHARWDDEIAEIERVYFPFDGPTITLVVPASTAVGTVIPLQNKVKASGFHPTRGAHRRGFFTLDGNGNLVVAKALTGIDDVRLLRTALDETILIDITAA